MAANIIHRGSTGHGKIFVDLETFQNSQLMLDVGEARDFSEHHLKIVEREGTSAISQEIQHIRDLAKSDVIAFWPEPQRSQARIEAIKVADTADKILAQRKWYSVSAPGLLEAAKAVGEAASPLVTSCVNVIALLGKLAK